MLEFLENRILAQALDQGPAGAPGTTATPQVQRLVPRGGLETAA